MDIDTESRPLVRCSICAKSFDDRKSALRHGSYCRQAKTRVRSRKRACVVCAKAKTRCDLSFPSCSRCVAKDLACGYEEPRTAPSQTQATESTAIQLEESAASGMQLVSKQTEPLLASQNSSMAAEAYNGDWAKNTSAMQYPDVPEPDFSKSLIYPPYAFELSFPQYSSTGFLTNSLYPSYLDFDQLVPRIPRAFQARKVANRHFALNRSFVTCKLRSWPYLMLPNKGLPPFIHRQGTKKHGTRQDPIEICATIVQMCTMKNKDNAAFIWRTIKMEQERILAEFSMYSNREILAALQAVTVYCLLRISEPNDDATDFDIPLINTMIALAMHLKLLLLSNEDPSISRMLAWEDWILAESLRRTITVLVLVDLLFDTASILLAQGYKCNATILNELVLPCGRDLWHASTRTEWEAACIGRGEGEKKTVGDLVNFREGELDGWLSQLDDFGTLVMSAASIQHWSRV